jgi:hypothetical protein
MRGRYAPHAGSGENKHKQTLRFRTFIGRDECIDNRHSRSAVLDHEEVAPKREIG